MFRWCTSRILFHLSGSMTAPGCLANSCTILPGLVSLSELVFSQAGLEEVSCWSAPANMSLALLARSDAESRPDLSAALESLVCKAPPDVHHTMVCCQTQLRFDDACSQLRTDNSIALLALRHSSWVPPPKLYNSRLSRMHVKQLSTHHTAYFQTYIHYYGNFSNWTGKRQ